MLSTIQKLYKSASRHADKAEHHQIAGQPVQANELYKTALLFIAEADDRLGDLPLSIGTRLFKGELCYMAGKIYISLGMWPEARAAVGIALQCSPPECLRRELYKLLDRIGEETEDAA